MLQINREKLVLATQSQMPGKRWEHTLGVIETSVRLADRYGADRAKADLAALLHDYCKYWPAEKLRAIVIEQSMPTELLEYDIQLLHAPVAAHVVKEEFGIADEEVLDAIRYHTSGRPAMTLLDKIVCLADYIEPNRDFPGVDQIRALSERSLEEALLAGFDSTIQFLLTKRQKIYPMTMFSRNALINELRSRV
jgi:predicted HD superfamily hydrolase involved in NAD metabolism